MSNLWYPTRIHLKSLGVYILFNDLNDCLRFCDIYQYADDTIILFAAGDVDEIEFAINDDLKRIG